MKSAASSRILVVDDDAGFRSLLTTILRGEGYEVSEAASVQEARVARGQPFDAVLTDLRLPDGDGLQVLRWFREHSPGTPVIVITGFGAVPTAVEAMKLGALDYLTKPLKSPDELRRLVRIALESEARKPAGGGAKAVQPKVLLPCGSLIAENPTMRRVQDMIQRVAPTSATVLISGESGTGKENVARCIHTQSPRSGQPFVAVNCAALSPSLIESELFGHEKGAFTGAGSLHVGRFERAHGGTLFLDEIGELDANLQAKLLRVLQEKAFERVGGDRLIAVDVRVVAATNRDLSQQVTAGRFRQDLYYRLNLFPIELPPLRQRGGDILLLARHFLGRACESLGRSNLSLTPAAEARLSSYPWPGNVRELQNTMERLAILAGEGVVDAVDVPLPVSSMALAPAAGVDRGLAPLQMRELEQQAIMEALAAHGGNRTKAARQLGISLRTLQYRLKEYSEDPSRAIPAHPGADPA
jgi:DNA-binding NtrC family response regulator